MLYNSLAKPTIGILGGSGPFAALDIEKRIFEQCRLHANAYFDQDYFNVVNYQYTQVNDRTDSYLSRDISPREQYLKCIQRLTAFNVDILGIACNSAHIYYDELVKNTSIAMKNIVIETVQYVISRNPNIVKVGLLATVATAKSGIYQKEFYKYDVNVIHPSPRLQDKIMQAIYIVKAGFFGDNLTKQFNFLRDGKIRQEELSNHQYKKMLSNPLIFDATAVLTQAINNLIENGSQTIILGCTELPLLLPEIHIALQAHIINPNQILAESLVKYAKALEQKKI